MKLWDFNGIGDEPGLEESAPEQIGEEAPKARRATIFSRIRDWLFFSAEPPSGLPAGGTPENGRAEQASPRLWERDDGPASAAEREQVAQALRQWQDATRYFENVDDPDLIEFAVYQMEASKRRYLCLLKRVRRMEA